MGRLLGGATPAVRPPPSFSCTCVWWLRRAQAAHAEWAKFAAKNLTSGPLAPKWAAIQAEAAAAAGAGAAGAP